MILFDLSALPTIDYVIVCCRCIPDLATFILHVIPRVVFTNPDSQDHITALVKVKLLLMLFLLRYAVRAFSLLCIGLVLSTYSTCQPL